MVDSKGRSVLKNYTFHYNKLVVVITVKLLITVYTMIVIIVINSVYNNRVPESYYRPSLVP